MKNIFTLTLFSALLLSQDLNAQSSVPSTAPYSAKFISANGSGQIWAFGSGAKHGDGLYFDFNGWQFVPYDLTHVPVSATSAYGKIVIADNLGFISEWNSNNKRWLKYAGISEVSDIDISKKNGNMKYAIGKVKQLDGSFIQGVYSVDNISTTPASWKPVFIDAVGGSFVKLAEDKAGNFYLVTKDGRFYSKNANDNQYSSTINVANKFVIDVQVGGDDQLYIMEKGGAIHKYNKAANSFSPVQLSASNFAVDDSSHVYGVVNNQIEAMKSGVRSIVTIKNTNEFDANGNTPLTAAVALSDQQKAQEVITAGAGVDVPNKKGDVPLTIAAKNGNIQMVNFLLSNKANPDAKDGEKHTALFYAVRNGNNQLAQALLLGKANASSEGVVETAVQLKNKEMLLLLSTYKADLTPGLSKAIEMNDAQMFKNLINYGATLTNNVPFEKAVDKNNKDIASTCLEHGADKELALAYCVNKNNKDMIGLCLAKGAKPDPAIVYVMNNSDVALAQDLMTKYNVSADKMLAKSIPEAGIQTGNTAVLKPGVGTTTSRPTTAKKPQTNLVIAEVALKNGANGAKYMDYAVEKKNTPLVELLLRYNGDANALLQAAVKNKNMDYAQMAITRGAKPILYPELIKNAVKNNDSKMTTLLVNGGAGVTDPVLIKMAVDTSNTEITRLLLQKGAPTSDPNLLPTAVSKNNKDIVRSLLEYGADPNSGIKSAVNANKTEMAVMMLEKGASASDPSLISTAVSKSNTQLVQKLLSMGADANNGMPNAVKSGNTSMFDLLVSNGADATKSEYVVSAVSANQVQMFKKLLDSGAPIAYTGRSNDNLLHLACRNGSYPISQILIERGVDVNQKTSTGDTPLHFAVDAGRNNVDLARLLVDAGADVNAKNNRGKSIYRTADGKKLKDYLKSQGASKK